jgi:ABC-2 type transport system ATP-binding protein
MTRQPQQVLPQRPTEETAGAVASIPRGATAVGGNGASAPEADLRGPRQSSASDDVAPMTLRGITKRWPKSQAPVLDGVDLTLDAGTRTWVGGRNGAGKTTLLRIAAGMIDCDRGEARVWGFTLRENRARYQRLVSFLPAGDRGLYARLTVRHQLTFWARIGMIEPRSVPSMVEETIDEFELRELADRRVDRMSMGQRQRLRIAMTFLTEPEVVLLDEPLTSLDAEGAEILDRSIEKLIADGGTLLWCSPSGEHLDREFDTRLVLGQGRLERI